MASEDSAPANHYLCSHKIALSGDFLTIQYLRRDICPFFIVTENFLFLVREMRGPNYIPSFNTNECLTVAVFEYHNLTKLFHATDILTRNVELSSMWFYPPKIIRNPEVFFSSSSFIYANRKSEQIFLSAQSSSSIFSFAISPPSRYMRNTNTMLCKNEIIFFSFFRSFAVRQMMRNVCYPSGSTFFICTRMTRERERKKRFQIKLEKVI